MSRMRNRAKLSQARLGKAVGRSRNAVQAWEVGDAMPEAEVFPKLAAELGIPLKALMALAGVEGEVPKADPVLAGLADQAEGLGRKLRALSTRPPEQSALAGARGVGAVRDVHGVGPATTGGARAPKKKR